MRAVVRAAFQAFATGFEARLSFMYLDKKGLVTTGVGTLIDPMSAAQGLPWVHKSDGATALPVEIVAEWNTVKGATALCRLGGRHFAQLTKLCLKDAAIDSLMLARLTLTESVLSRGFDKWEDFPAAAQLGILDMAWNLGPGRLVPGPVQDFPHFYASAVRGDWAGCADECTIVGAPAERNACHDRLFRLAAAGGDPNALGF